LDDEIPPKLREIAEKVHNGEKQNATVREFLRYFDFYRRGFIKVRRINAALERVQLSTRPDFRDVWIDDQIEFVPSEAIGESAPEPSAEEPKDAVTEKANEAPPATALANPTYRIVQLDAARQGIVSVKPDEDIAAAITLMLQYDFSQLPVMQNERVVKGIVSWSSIGMRLAFKRVSEKVRDCLQPHQEVSEDAYLYDAIPTIVQYEYVLVRGGTDNRITGIVTASDLAVQLRQLSEPFLLLGEIERHVRRLLEGKISLDDIRGNFTLDYDRSVERLSDLTLGEYIRIMPLLKNEWVPRKIGPLLFIDRMVSNDAGSYALVKAEAAAGGGRRPAFTRA
jgi:CBS domain-containing protein